MTARAPIPFAGIGGPQEPPLEPAELAAYQGLIGGLLRGAGKLALVDGVRDGVLEAIETARDLVDELVARLPEHR